MCGKDFSPSLLFNGLRQKNEGVYFYYIHLLMYLFDMCGECVQHGTCVTLLYGDHLPTFLMCMSVLPACVCAYHIHAWSERVSDHLELELQMVTVSHLVGAKDGRSASALTQGAISLASVFVF